MGELCVWGIFIMTYYEQLKDPRWQRKRLEILNRDNFTCQDCKSENTSLHVHHTHYTKNTLAWEYDSNSLITLCECCHDTITWLKHDAKLIIDTEFILSDKLQVFTNIIHISQNMSIEDLSKIFKYAQSL